jgi:2-oxoglutarate dehydrogenase E1 component
MDLKDWGPEHSSARLERFLQLCAGDNIQVAYPTTPAQYFHLLRRQVNSRFRKPLIILTPKSLLRHPLAVSTLDDLAAGSFHEILDDPIGVRDPKKVLICSGKIYYELFNRRKELEISSLAILRLEQLYPFPADRLKKVIKKYTRADHWCWVQEEPANMGGWQFVKPRLEDVSQKKVRYVGRAEASSPATGFPKKFVQEQNQIIAEAVGSPVGGRDQAAVN